jgi:beta-phosphoglucomutase-like phosphatase (HAD superfamily)
VIFDVDGTLVDTNDFHASSWVQALGDFGIQAELQDIRAQMGKGGDQMLPVLLSPDLLKEKGAEIEKHRGELFKRECLPHVCGFPSVRPLFERIRSAGQTIVLASSGRAAEVERYQEIAGIADLVDAVTTKDDAEHSKPCPDIFEAALERIAPITPGEAVVVGDSPFDAEAAAKAGLRTVGLLCGGFSEKVLRDAGCVEIYRNPEDLLANYERSALANGVSATLARALA